MTDERPQDRVDPPPQPSRRALLAFSALSAAAVLPGYRLFLDDVGRSSYRRLPADFFGLHINNLSSDPLWHPHTDYVDLGQRWLRSWSNYTSWKLINTAPGVYDWHRLDETVDIAEKHGLKLLYVLGAAPDWATGHTTGDSQYSAAPPTDQAWVQWVRAVVKRYRGRIAAYELWNEPNLASGWTGTVDQLVHLARLAAPIIRTGAPDAKILSPSPTLPAGVDYLSKMVDAGMLGQCDAVAVHPYTAVPEDVTTLLAQFAAVVHTAKPDMPLWNTEFGWVSYHARDGRYVATKSSEVMPIDQATSYVARYVMCSAAAPIAKSFFFTADGTPVMKTPIIASGSDQILPPGMAHRHLATLLSGSRIGQLERHDGHFELHGKTAKGRRFLAAWCSDGQNAVIDAKKYLVVNAADPLGRPIARDSMLQLSMLPTIFTLR